MQTAHTPRLTRVAIRSLLMWSAIMLLSGASVRAQSMYLEDGQSGLGPSMGYTRVYGTDGGYFGAGLGIAGRLDLGIRTAGVDDIDAEVSWRFGPNVAVYPIKQREGAARFSLAVTGSAEFYRRSRPSDMETPQVYYGGLLLFTDYRVKHGTFLQPRAGLSYRFVDRGEMDSGLTGQIGLSFYSRTRDWGCFAIMAAVSTDLDEVQLDMGLDVTFPFTGWREL